MDINIAKLSNQIDFTKHVIETGLADQLVEEGEWFEIEAKLMFDKSVLRTVATPHDAHRLLGVDLNSDHLKTDRKSVV